MPYDESYASGNVGSTHNLAPAKPGQLEPDYDLAHLIRLYMMKRGQTSEGPSSLGNQGKSSLMDFMKRMMTPAGPHDNEPSQSEGQGGSRYIF